MQSFESVHPTFLGRLRRDARGNVLAMMAISLFPLSALAGSAVDMARLYVVKVRLQQACDAGVLAGRKFMADDGSSTLDSTATTRATTFFNNNFSNGFMRAATASFTPTKTADNQVAGTASVTVPMTVMKMFNASDVTLSVSCTARYDIADTDIVFILDTTGSMACRPEDDDPTCNAYIGANPAVAYTRPSSDPDATSGYLGSTSYGVPETTVGNGSRIKAVRQAVQDFYQTMASNVDPSTHIRYGFVTYTSTVNAGKAALSANSNYVVGGVSGESWNYQSRYVTADYVSANSSWTNTSPAMTSSACAAADVSPPRTPSTPLTYNPSTGTASRPDYQWNSSSSKCQVRTQTLIPVWTYKQIPLQISDYVSGLTVTDPTKVNGATTAWDGCLEERKTETGATTFTSASYDLDPDLIPTSDIQTRWKPMWADVIYGRPSTATATTNGDGSIANWGTTPYRQAGYVSCGKPVHRLSTMTATDVANYVNAADFKPLGGTYHDTGMIWGTRLLSPNGIFANDTAAWPGRPAPKRVIIFLTDGDMAPNQSIYGMYGIEYLDQRVSGGDFTNLKNYHNARFLAECAKANALNIDVWTVSIATSATPQLTQCASSSTQALYTTTGTGLSDAFKKIAKQVAMLRMSQ